jgi:SAM-dependent methyltransferase
LPRDRGPILEAMCGSGRLLLPLIEQGFNIHGVDRSASMLASCEARLAASGLKALLFRQGLVELNLPFRYGAEFIAAGSFQLLARGTDANAALEHLRAHLVPPGHLLVEFFVPEEAEHPPGAPPVEVRGVKLADGARISLRSEVFYDTARKRIDTVSRYERREGATIVAREDERIALTWYDEDEAVAMFRAAGFAEVTLEPATAPAPGGGKHFAIRAAH